MAIEQESEVPNNFDTFLRGHAEQREVVAKKILFDLRNLFGKTNQRTIDGLVADQALGSNLSARHYSLVERNLIFTEQYLVEFKEIFERAATFLGIPNFEEIWTARTKSAVRAISDRRSKERQPLLTELAPIDFEPTLETQETEE